jgi:deoxyribodipyrimidine photo-lyase
MRKLVWLRSDLRVSDNTALHHAAADARARGDGQVIAVFVVSPQEWIAHDLSPARLSLMLRTLGEVSDELARLNIPLLILTASRAADVPTALLDLARTNRCDAIYFSGEYEVDEQRRDAQVRRAFEEAGLRVRCLTDQVVLAPDEVQKGSGGYYTVFTPYKRAWIARVQERASSGATGVSVLPRPPKLSETGLTRSSIPRLEDIPGLLEGFGSRRPADSLWPPGEREAQKRLDRFVASRIEHYDTARDFPATDGTSVLSPYLAIGAISPRQCLAAALAAAAERKGGSNSRNAGQSPTTMFEQGPKGISTWISELIWREFYVHVLAGFPRVCMGRAFQIETERLAWRYDEEALERWKAGKTGYPIVDAGMRQMLATGWMHNRVRMITAMFFSKHLLMDWRIGEKFFMQNLVDGFFASNNGGWQWAASTGTDAAPYFRIFNPYSQSRKFDARGEYIRRWVPELAELDDEQIHEPHKGGLFGSAIDYPEPVVDHAEARVRAIDAFKRLRNG